MASQLLYSDGQDDREFWGSCIGQQELMGASNYPFPRKAEINPLGFGGGDGGGGYRGGHEGRQPPQVCWRTEYDDSTLDVVIERIHQLPLPAAAAAAAADGIRSQKGSGRRAPQVCRRTELSAVDDPPVSHSTQLDSVMERLRRLLSPTTTAVPEGGARSENKGCGGRGSDCRFSMWGDASERPGATTAAGWRGSDPPVRVRVISQFEQLERTGALPLLRGVDAFESLRKIGEGGYGVVFGARDRRTGETVALKKMSVNKRGRLPATVLREIGILASLRHHPCIVGLKEVVSGGKDGVFMVMEYAELDLHGVIDGMRRPLTESEVKFLMLRLLQGIKYVHDHGVLHRDLKPSNILLNRRGELKICDFGLSRRCLDGEDESSRRVQEEHPYTDWVATLWYRAPELLLQAERYSAAVDMWSLGCIMGEMLWKAPLFKGEDDVDQLHHIFTLRGTPNVESWPDYPALSAQMNLRFHLRHCNRLRQMLPPSCLSEAGYDLLLSLLRYDPRGRMTVDEALSHSWFREYPSPAKLRL